MDRRDFIKLTAIGGTSATLAGCGSPEHQLIRFVPDEDLVPGVAEWKPSICPACSAGCAVNVRVMDADVETVRNGQPGVVAMTVAKKLEGLAKDPISQGGLCARGQASIQITYHPDRLTQPMKRSGPRGSGLFTPVSWDEAIGELVTRLDALAGASDQTSLAYLTLPRHSGRVAFAAEFVAAFGAPGLYAFEPFDDAVLRLANARSFGKEQLPTIDLGRAHFVISFGADFLGTWNSPVAQSAAYGVMRHGRPPAVRGRFVQIEQRMSVTGANADQWISVKPGTEGVVALGLAHVLMANKLRPAASAPATYVEGWAAGLPAYAPARVEQITGLSAKRLEMLAREMAESAPAVAVVGGAPLAHTNGLFTAHAVNALNELLGAVGRPGGMYFTPGVSEPPVPSSPPVQALAASKVLLVDGSNPVYGSPKALKVREALEKVPFIASFGSFIDDTSVFADLMLPDHSFLESWVEASPESGTMEAVKTVAPPVMKPLHQTRSTVDLLIEVASKLKSPIALPWKTAEDVAKSTAEPTAAVRRQQVRMNRQHTPASYIDPRFDGDATQFPFHFLPYKSVQFGDGSTAHLPWLQEMPDPLTSAMWSSWVEINPQTAERLHVAQGDLVEITSTQGSVRAPAMIFPGIAPDVVAMPAGNGHEVFTRYASGRGANPLAILAPVTEEATGSLAWAATRVKIARVGGDDRRLIMFAGELRAQPHEGERR